MENRPLNWKDDILFKCPHCGYDEEYTVYLNVEEITCFVCEKTFRVQLYAANVELKPVGEV